MNLRSPVFERAALWCAFGSASLNLVSIAVAHTLLALAVAFLLLSGVKLRFPPILLPLAVFMGLTVISLLLSGHPAEGRPQIRKFFVYLILLVVMSTFRQPGVIRKLALAWMLIGSASAVRGLYQFWQKQHQAQAAGLDFYRSYVADRITGFMSHWMTFGGLMMIVFLVTLALLFWGWPSERERIVGWIAAPVVGLAIVLGFTRGIWLGWGLAALYLLWFWRRWAVVVAPAVIGLIVLANPAGLRERITSLTRPQGTLDSNQHRIVTWRTGLEMVKAHPWFGVGPQQVQSQFERYVPADIGRPLPEGWYGHLHNDYLHYAAERGIPALLALLWLLGRVFRDWIRDLRANADGRTRWILHAGIAALGATLITGLFELNLGDSEVLLMVLALIAAVYVAIEEPACA
jgi:putative inorganic carbon (hco3(-)) transporter